jgi:hypothetical protein
MTEAGSTGQVQPVDDAWATDPEVPDADADEQHRELVDNPDEADPETVAGRDRRDRLREPPLEVSEADLADQLVDVPFDDEAERD